MIATRCTLLGGEGCPAADIGEAAENRNNYGIGLADPCRFEQNSARTCRIEWHETDTTERIIVLDSFREEAMTNDNDSQTDLQEKFRAAITMAVDLCLDAGLHPSNMIGPLKDQLAWCEDAAKRSSS